MTEPVRVTPFQHRVYQATSTIPKGRVTTYQSLAQAIHCASAQAVGQALRRNPFAPEVPCHRVISAQNTIGGFSGCKSGEMINKKIALLKQEGVEFKNGKLADPARLIDLPPLPPA